MRAEQSVSNYIVRTKDLIGILKTNMEFTMSEKEKRQPYVRGGGGVFRRGNRLREIQEIKKSCGRSLPSNK